MPEDAYFHHMIQFYVPAEFKIWSAGKHCVRIICFCCQDESFETTRKSMRPISKQDKNESFTILMEIKIQRAPTLKCTSCETSTKPFLNVLIIWKRKMHGLAVEEKCTQTPTQSLD